MRQWSLVVGGAWVVIYGATTVLGQSVLVCGELVMQLAGGCVALRLLYVARDGVMPSVKWQLSGPSGRRAFEQEL